MSLEIVARINGEVVTIPLHDVQCVRITAEGEGSAIRIMPGTVARCIELGATALVREMQTRPSHEVARECANPDPRFDSELFAAAKAPA